jgi:hypothetical protein
MNTYILPFIFLVRKYCCKVIHITQMQKLFMLAFVKHSPYSKIFQMGPADSCDLVCFVYVASFLRKSVSSV